MKPVYCIVIFIKLIIFTAIAQQPEIVDFFNHSNSADYLIITPRIFSEGATRLAQYRNEFGGDDVEMARYVTIENLYDKFQGTQSSPDSILHKAIACALDQWELPPSYIVLIGTDVAVWAPGDSLPKHGGPMPSMIEWEIIQSEMWDQFVQRDTIVHYNDFGLYKSYIDSVSGREIFRTNLPAIGRIPCDSPEEFDRYIEKVNFYDALKAAPWRNRVLFLSDNSMQSSKFDPIDHTSVTQMVMNAMKGRFQTSLHLSRFTVDTLSHFSSEVKETFFNSINNGYGWLVFFAHGHSSMLTDESFLSIDDTPLLKNYTTPTVVFSLSCSNGAFYEPVDNSMCKSWLFSADGGAIAYIASPNEEYANTNEKFMEEITLLNDSLSMSIGSLLAIAKQRLSNYHCQYYNILGDPALRASPERVKLGLQMGNDRKVICTPETGFSSGDSLYWECAGKIAWHDSIRQTDYLTDTLLFSGTANLSGNSAEIELPEFPGNDTLRFTAYAWNRTFESRGELLIRCNAGSAIHPSNTVELRSRQFHVWVSSQRTLMLSFENIVDISTAELFTVNGRRIASVNIPTGSKQLVWHNPSLASGTYIVQLRTAHSHHVSARIIIQ